MDMNRLAHLEYPAPKIALSTDRIDAHGAEIIEGSFEVLNIGEGELVGRINSCADFLRFSPETFSGNKISIGYSFNMEGLSGEHQAVAVIMSTGGEKTVKFNVKVSSAELITNDSTKIASLEHFLEYVRKSPVAARRLFVQKDFMILLFNMGYSSMDIYEKFVTDPNKERAVDNFLVFNGLKSKAAIVVQEPDVIMNVSQGESTATGGIALRKTAWGDAEADLHVRQGGDWLKLSKNRVTDADFNDDNVAEVDYVVLADKIKGRSVAIVDVQCDTPRQVRLQCNISGAFDARLDRESYFFEDRGRLFLKNNTGNDLMIDIYCENFVKFAAKRYIISAYAEIDFVIKFSSLRAATMAFRKQLYVTTQIHVRAVATGVDTVKRMRLKLWGGA